MAGYSDYNDPRLQPPEPPVFKQCAQCEGDIGYGETIYTFGDGDTIHADCWDAYAREKLDPHITTAGD